jgi:transposase-like protein
MIPAHDKYQSALWYYSEGLSIEEIAHVYGVSRQSMWKILQRRGCKFRKRLRFGKKSHFYRGGSISIKEVQYIVATAVRNGHLTKPSHCEMCGEDPPRIEAHHSDYNKPLEVGWLCKKCHYAWHKKNKAKSITVNRRGSK